jgi:hypothetical protein
MADNINTFMCRLSWDPQPPGTLRACMGIALPFLTQVYCCVFCTVWHFRRSMLAIFRSFTCRKEIDFDLLSDCVVQLTAVEEQTQRSVGIQHCDECG